MTHRRLLFRLLSLSIAACLPRIGVAQPPAPLDTGLVAQYRGAADYLIDTALSDSSTYDRLTALLDRFGNRPAGSLALERSIDWILSEMDRDGLQNVHGEDVIVPRWVRGAESAEIISPRRQTLPILGLGNSVGTPPTGVTADGLVVTSFSELTEEAARARGRIVVFDTHYASAADAARYARDGANAASRVGALGVLMRSDASFSLRSPHAEGLAYDTTLRAIPAASITTEDAALLHRLQDRGERLTVRMTMEGRALAPTRSRNIVAELLGAEHPDEVVVLGGHIDSWDVGQGAQDDAGGAVAAWDAVRLMAQLGLRPRRTIRVVLWTNAENGGSGGTAYRDEYGSSAEKHVAALEADDGVFAPKGFAIAGSDASRAVVMQLARLLERVGATSVVRDSAAAAMPDAAPLRVWGLPVLGLDAAGERYDWVRHTDGDTIDKVDPRELAMCVASLAVMAYVLADLPDPLPR